MTVDTDVSGQVIRRRESDNNYSQGDPNAMWYRFAGRQMGMITNNGGWEGSYAASVAQRHAAPATTAPSAFANGATVVKQAEQFSSNLEVINSYSQGSDIIRTTTNYNNGGTWDGANYALGQVMNVTSNSHRNWANHSNSTTTYGYAWYQGAVQQSINHTQTGSPADNTWFSYNHVPGQAVMTQASISDGRSRTVNYATNLMGEVVKRWETASGTKHPITHPQPKPLLPSLPLKQSSTPHPQITNVKFISAQLN